MGTGTAANMIIHQKPCNCNDNRLLKERPRWLITALIDRPRFLSPWHNLFDRQQFSPRGTIFSIGSASVPVAHFFDRQRFILRKAFIGQGTLRNNLRKYCAKKPEVFPLAFILSTLLCAVSNYLPYPRMLEAIQP